MKVTKAGIVTLAGFVMNPALIVRECCRCASIKFFRLVFGSINAGLLIFAAGCSFKKQTVGELLGEPAVNAPVEKQPESTPAADNSFCYVCHINYDGEELTLGHEKAGIGCSQCHGRSSNHSSDERNITPPDIMYPKAKINPSCMSCHPRDKLAQEDAHEPILSSKATQQRYCTDCHGERHRIKVRTIRWNKATGELLE